jgi:hypothetical protein
MKNTQASYYRCGRAEEEASVRIDRVAISGSLYGLVARCYILVLSRVTDGVTCLACFVSNVKLLNTGLLVLFASYGL